MEVLKTSLPGVFEIIPQRYGDERGWFSETWHVGRLRKAGISVDFVQDNHSASTEAGTLRGLHYQSPPRAQDKLVRCTRGAILDVVVDVRKGSQYYGRWFSSELDAHNGKQLLVPKGFLHGFLTLQPHTEVQYKVSDFYDATRDGSVRWDSLGIDWGISSHPVLSEKDENAPAFEDWESPFNYEIAL